jgi:predicted glycoside hydrolase/deacetylase ChbG (UPF0249 family)
MLIVNADDPGRSVTATDAALACFARGRITSTSAMVFMRDSVRAAKLATEAGIPVGLHINLSEAFSGDNVPGTVRAAHDEVRRFLKSSKFALILFHPLLTRQFALSFQAQVDEFRRLYGREPSHFDGHQHLHLSTNMLLQGLLPAGAKVRRSFSFEPGERSFVNRAYRGAIDRRIGRRHRLTRHFYCLSHCLSPQKLDRVVALAASSDVEIMTHPERAAEFAFLISGEFAAALSKAPTGSYAELQ